MRTYKTPTRDKVLALLKSEGPLTCAEMADMLLMDVRSINSAVRIARKLTGKDKILYIHSWKRSYGTRGRWAARWDLGSQQDRKPPVSDRNENNRRYREKHREVLRLRTQVRRHGAESINPFFQTLGVKRSDLPQSAVRAMNKQGKQKSNLK